MRNQHNHAAPSYTPDTHPPGSGGLAGENTSHVAWEIFPYLHYEHFHLLIQQAQKLLFVVDTLLYVCIHAGLEVGVGLDVDIDEILVQHC